MIIKKKIRMLSEKEDLEKEILLKIEKKKLKKIKLDQ